jgi:hypothetical protein
MLLELDAIKEENKGLAKENVLLREEVRLLI